MSILVANRVWATDILPTGRKLVALKLANHCDDLGGSLFVGMAAIARDCGVSRSQAQRHMHALIDAGLLSVIANEQGGAPGMVRHYRLHVARLADPSTKGGARVADARAGGDMTSAMNGPDSTHATGGTDATRSAYAAHGSHGCGDGVAPMRLRGSADATQTITNHQLTTKEPNKKARTPKASAVDTGLTDLHAGVDEQVWQDWVALRKGKKAPITRTALTSIAAEAAKAGLSLTEALTLGCSRGWTGFEATWVLRDEVRRTKHTNSVSSHTGFEKLNYREGINHDGSFK
ncbi:MAG: helix-turn-helix domain-containing protein [Pseudomonadota bacterium]